MNTTQNGLGRMFAGAAKIIVTLTVLAFLGLHTLNFFAWTFPDEQAIYRPLGFALTGGGLIAYLAIFKWIAKTDLQRFVAISMIFVCGIGELAAAGFGMQVEAYQSAGIGFTREEIDLMIWAIRILGGIHALALILDFVGDDIAAAWTNRQQEPIPAPALFQPAEEPRRFEQAIPSPITTRADMEAKVKSQWGKGNYAVAESLQDLANTMPQDEPTPARSPFPEQPVG